MRRLYVFKKKISSNKKNIFITARLDIYRCGQGSGAKKIPINIGGVPITMGILFPEDALKYINNVRLFNSQGKKIPVQTTEVTTLLPSSPNMKWAWIIFFLEESSSYTLEFGPDVSHKLFPERIVSENNMRLQGGISVNTDPLHSTIDKKESGFVNQVHLPFSLIDLDFRQLR